MWLEWADWLGQGEQNWLIGVMDDMCCPGLTFQFYLNFQNFTNGKWTKKLALPLKFHETNQSLILCAFRWVFPRLAGATSKPHCRRTDCGGQSAHRHNRPQHIPVQKACGQPVLQQSRVLRLGIDIYLGAHSQPHLQSAQKWNPSDQVSRSGKSTHIAGLRHVLYVKKCKKKKKDGLLIDFIYSSEVQNAKKNYKTVVAM